MQKPSSASLGHWRPQRTVGAPASIVKKYATTNAGAGTGAGAAAAFGTKAAMTTTPAKSSGVSTTILRPTPRTDDIHYISRPPGVPFDISTPQGQLHGRVSTSTGGDKKQHCSVDDEPYFEAKDLAGRLRYLHTVARVCTSDFSRRFNRYSYFTESPDSYALRSDLAAYCRTRRVFVTFKKTLRKAERAKILTEDDHDRLLKTLDILHKKLKSMQTVVGYSGAPKVAKVPFPTLAGPA